MLDTGCHLWYQGRDDIDEHDNMDSVGDNDG